MLNWQFLLQKKGDFIWSAIDSPKLKIEEGIYRILGQGSCSDREVEVRCTYQDFLARQVSNCLSKKTRRLDRLGLIVVIPFTYLDPGYWEFSCCYDLLFEMLGSSWHDRLQLQVLPTIDKTEKPKKFRKKVTIERDKQEISSSSVFDFLPNPKSIARSQIFAFPQEIPRKKEIKTSKAEEFFASRKVRSCLLHEETRASLAGIALNIIDWHNLNLLELFKKPISWQEIKLRQGDREKSQQIKTLAEQRKTQSENLSSRLHLPNLPKITKLVTDVPLSPMRDRKSRLQTSLGQILPPKIATSSPHKKRQLPQLPKLISSPIPTINLNKPASFKITKANNQSAPLTSGIIRDRSIDSKIKLDSWHNSKVDRKFAALRSKERFLANLHSLTEGSQKQK